MKTKNVTLYKFLLCLMGLVVLMATPACKFSDQKQPVQQHSADGGADGGGGDVVEDEPMSNDNFSRAMQQDKVLVKLALNYQAELYELVQSRGAPLIAQALFKGMTLEKIKAVYARLFPAEGSRSVYDELRTVKFNWANELCHDTHFQDKDASAINADPLEVCLSKKTIQKKVTRNTGLVLVTSLLGHELVHRMGGSEEDAHMLQLLIQRTMNLGMIDMMIPGKLNFEFQLALEALSKNYLNFETLLSEDAVDTCVRLSYVVKYADTVLNDNIYSRGIKRYTPQTRKLTKRALTITRNLMHYCEKESSGKRAYFAKQPSPEYISYLDKEALLTNFEILKDTLEVAFKELEESGFKVGEFCVTTGWGPACAKR